MAVLKQAGEAAPPTAHMYEMPLDKKNDVYDSDALWVELKQFVHYLTPPTISYALDTGVEIVCLLNIAKLGEHDLAAAGLAFMLSNMTGHAVYTGFSTALGTLAAQAYGAQKYTLVGHILQQSMLVVVMFLPCIALLWLFAGQLFELAGVAPSIAQTAGRFITLQILSLPPMALMQLLKVWLEAQGILRPITSVSIVVLLLTILFSFLFIDRDLLGLGVYGAPVAVFFAYTLGDVAFLGYIWWSGVYRQTWTGFSSRVMVGFGAFATLSIMGAGMVCLEWWSYEVLGVVGSAVSEQATAVQTVLINFAYFMYALPEGIAIAAGARVGNALGAGDAVSAKRAAFIAISLALASALITVLPIAFSNGMWAGYFLREVASVELVAACSPPLVLFLILNSGYGALSGILLGSGKQQVGFMANLVACYLLGIPLGLLLAFPLKMGILGLWWGQVSGVGLLFFGLAVYLSGLDWDKLAVEIAAKAQEGDEELSEREAAALALIEASLDHTDQAERGATRGAAEVEMAVVHEKPSAPATSNVGLSKRQ
mmetsp:Transcript_54482/g.129415  ORF Transcript_54482/g.129415 Transcript_54482/m.129415 type:complete len:541 (+) Transcript_54482:38-1660(+)